MISPERLTAFIMPLSVFIRSVINPVYEFYHELSKSDKNRSNHAGYMLAGFPDIDAAPKLKLLCQPIEVLGFIEKQEWVFSILLRKVSVFIGII